MRKISDTEIEIMKILWKRGEPITFAQILEETADTFKREWVNTMTALACTINKGYVRCDRNAHINFYTAAISKEQYLLQKKKT